MLHLTAPFYESPDLSTVTAKCGILCLPAWSRKNAYSNLFYAILLAALIVTLTATLITYRVTLEGTKLSE